MTDSRLKGEWLYAPTFFELSDRAWRLFTGALMWSNEQGTDGRIRRLYFDRLLPSGPAPQEEAELLGAGLLLVDGDELVVPNWDSEMGQSAAAVVEEQRRKARERQAEWRKRQSLRRDPATRDVTRDIAGYVGSGSGDLNEESPESYVTRDVTRIPTEDLVCPRHPDGDTGEPCGGCKRVKDARAARSTPDFEKYQANLEGRCATQGHERAEGSRYCSWCMHEFIEVA